MPIPSRFIFFLLMLALVHWPLTALGHGPGRKIRVETGYCGTHPHTVENAIQQHTPHPDGIDKLCFRTINLESFPIAVRLQYLPGEITSEGIDVCVVSSTDSPTTTPGWFESEGQSCQKLAFIVAANGQKDITAHVPLQISNNDLTNEALIRCVHALAQPVDITGELHDRGVHIKGKRNLHMLRVENPPHAPLPSPPTLSPDTSTICDPVSPILAKVAETINQKSSQPVASPPDPPAEMVTEKMTHPGMPSPWIWAAWELLLGFTLMSLWSQPPMTPVPSSYPMVHLPILGPFVRLFTRNPRPLVFLKIVALMLFGLVIYAGLAGTNQANANFATVFVWNLWWPGVILSILVVGTGWCAICPWDTMASMLVRHRLFRRQTANSSLMGKVPAPLRNTYPALLLFLSLTWLELGMDATTRPTITAIMAIVMVSLALMSLLLFERKAFCRYFCPVGRTLGLYACFSPVAVRPIQQATCDSCATMTCYHGSTTLAPCPTHLTVGRFAHNTYCLSCGNCVFSCPDRNVTWHARTMGTEAAMLTRPSWDAAWFILVLLGTTLFHGFSMTSGWESLLTTIALTLGERAPLTVSFILGMLTLVLLPIPFFALGTFLIGTGTYTKIHFRQRFAALSFACLPLAFVYHLAHNLAHLLREGGNLKTLFADPLGHHTQMAMTMCPMPTATPMDATSWERPLLYTSQIALIVLGYYLFMQVLRYRSRQYGLYGDAQRGFRLWPLITFGLAISGVSLWLLGQEMVMRF